tara:strand:+ start:754 stop:1521 length:768 start_codon:yes stop_codon:yes gene_type:complete
MILNAESLEKMSNIRHAFFTRRGGVSRGIYSSLNCGLGSHDKPVNVEANRARAAAALGMEPDSLCTAAQEHGTKVVVVDRPWPRETSPVADAMVTNQPGITLGVLSADCATILLADTRSGIIGAAHAGWRGALAGIVASIVNAMTQLGAHTEQIFAVVGPCIGSESYLVDMEFPLPFLANNPANSCFFHKANDANQITFDLRSFVERQLLDAGVYNTSSINMDTFLNSDTFFSYRRALRNGEKDYGRALSAIALV